MASPGLVERATNLRQRRPQVCIESVHLDTSFQTLNVCPEETHRVSRFSL